MTFQPPSRGRGHVKGQHMCLHCVLCFIPVNLICNMKTLRKEKKPFDPTPGVKGVCKGKIFASMLLYALFLFIDMQHDHILKMIFCQAHWVYLLVFFCSGIHSVLITVSINFISFVQYINTYKAKQ